MNGPLLLGIVAALILAVLIVGAWAYRRWLDRTEDWNPWADTMVLPVIVGRHRLDEIATPFRLPGWDEDPQWRNGYVERLRAIRDIAHQ